MGRFCVQFQRVTIALPFLAVILILSEDSAAQKTGDLIFLPRQKAEYRIESLGTESAVVKSVTTGAESRLPLYRRGDPKMLLNLKHDGTLDGAIIQLLDMSQLASADCTVRISDCTIFECRGADSVDVFPRTVEIRDCDFRSALGARSTVFGDSLLLTGCNFREGISFRSCTFQGPVKIAFCACQKSTYLDNSVFDSPVSVRFTDFYGRAMVTGAQFNSALTFVHSNFYGDGALLNGTTFMKYTDFYGCKFFRSPSFYGSRFADAADFTSSFFRSNSSLAGASFTGFAKFTDIKFFDNPVDSESAEKASRFLTHPFDNSLRFQKVYTYASDTLIQRKQTFLGRAYFKDGCNIEVDDDISPLGIGLEDLDRVWIYTKDTIEINNERMLNNAIKYVNGISDSPADLKSRVLDRLDYQLFKLKLKYATGFRYTWFGLIDTIVKDGYRGGVRIFSIAMLIVIVFSVVFFLFHRSEVMMQLRENVHRKDTRYIQRLNELPATGNNKFLEYAQCLWFSTTLFLTPRFSSDYFKFSNRAQFLIMGEWALGLFFVIIYLVFVASKYQFVHALLGF